jgi:S1-C subfamily serine protease
MQRTLLALVLLLAAAMAVPYAPAQAQTFFRSSSGGTRLGVSLQDVTPRLKEREKLSVSEGAYVSDVAEESPADRAGIEEGDVIVSFAGKPITESDELVKAVKKAPTGEPVEVVLDRAGQKKTLTVKLRKSSNSYSFSSGGGSHGFAVTPPSMPRAPRAFNFNIVTMQVLEGMQVQKLTKQLAEYFEVPSGRGLLVTAVEKRSPASEAGVKAGDVIVKVNSSAVRDIDELREDLSEKENQSVSVEIIRHGKSQTLTLKVEGDGDEDEDEDDDVSMNITIPPMTHGAMRASIGAVNKDFLRELHETLSQMQERIRQKMERLQERISDRVLRM